MRRVFEQIFQKPFIAIVSGIELWTERLKIRQLIDGAISRFVHLINRPSSSKEKDLNSAGTHCLPNSEEQVLIKTFSDKAENDETFAAAPFLTNSASSENLNEDWSEKNALRTDNKEKLNFEEKKEEMDRDLRDDMLKLVRYKVLFVKREYEHAFAEQEDLVSENMDAGAFTAWKIAEFIQRLAELDTRVPEKWEKKKYPDKIYCKEVDVNGSKRKYLLGLPDEDKKYLRIYHEVLDRYPREKFKYEEQQIDVLREIRDEIRDNKDSQGGQNP